MNHLEMIYELILSPIYKNIKTIQNNTMQYKFIKNSNKSIIIDKSKFHHFK